MPSLLARWDFAGGDTQGWVLEGGARVEARGPGYAVVLPPGARACVDYASPETRIYMLSVLLYSPSPGSTTLTVSNVFGELRLPSPPSPDPAPGLAAPVLSSRGNRLCFANESGEESWFTDARVYLHDGYGNSVECGDPNGCTAAFTVTPVLPLPTGKPYTYYDRIHLVKGTVALGDYFSCQDLCSPAAAGFPLSQGESVYYIATEEAVPAEPPGNAGQAVLLVLYDSTGEPVSALIGYHGAGWFAGQRREVVVARPGERHRFFEGTVSAVYREGASSTLSVFTTSPPGFVDATVYLSIAGREYAASTGSPAPVDANMFDADLAGYHGPGFLDASVSFAPGAASTMLNVLLGPDYNEANEIVLVFNQRYRGTSEHASATLVYRRHRDGSLEHVATHPLFPPISVGGGSAVLYAPDTGRAMAAIMIRTAYYEAVVPFDSEAFVESPAPVLVLVDGEPAGLAGPGPARLRAGWRLVSPYRFRVVFVR